MLLRPRWLATCSTLVRCRLRETLPGAHTKRLRGLCIAPPLWQSRARHLQRMSPVLSQPPPLFRDTTLYPSRVLTRSLTDCGVCASLRVTLSSRLNSPKVGGTRLVTSRALRAASWVPAALAAKSRGRVTPAPGTHHGTYQPACGALWPPTTAAAPTGSDWRLLKPGVSKVIPKLQKFEDAVDFCDAVARAGQPGAATLLQQHLVSAFIFPVLLPALHQTAVGPAVATTACVGALAPCVLTVCAASDAMTIGWAGKWSNLASCEAHWEAAVGDAAASSPSPIAMVLTGFPLAAAATSTSASAGPLLLGSGGHS